MSSSLRHALHLRGFLAARWRWTRRDDSVWAWVKTFYLLQKTVGSWRDGWRVGGVNAMRISTRAASHAADSVGMRFPDGKNMRVAGRFCAAAWRNMFPPPTVACTGTVPAADVMNGTAPLPRQLLATVAQRLCAMRLWRAISASFFTFCPASPFTICAH